MDRDAFTSAGGDFPYKIIKNKQLLLGILDNKYISPIHIQLNPTNKCNLRCKFCSCSERDRSIEMPLSDIIDLFDRFAALGCKSITITGGGEPLMHKDIERIIEEALLRDIAVGLVTNGLLLHKISSTIFRDVTWVRVSVSDESDIHLLFDEVSGICHSGGDWSFSYVVSDNGNADKISNVLYFAEDEAFSHVRIVNDILNPTCNLQSLRDRVLMTCRDYGINDRLAIWQDRQHYSVGRKRCLISLLKPVITASGHIVGCCGVQYAKPSEIGDYPKSMLMGSIKNIEEIWRGQHFFDGSRCVKCYYDHYNIALIRLVDDIKHERHV